MLAPRGCGVLVIRFVCVPLAKTLFHVVVALVRSPVGRGDTYCVTAAEAALFLLRNCWISSRT